MTGERSATERLRPYVAGLSVDWLQSSPQVRHRRVEGTLAFVDISGFTTLTERLAAHGKAGAEEMSDVLDTAFATLLEDAYGYGASLVKWGGDAVLLLFEGPEHPVLAARASLLMQQTMRRIGRLRTSVGTVQLRMSIGVHSGAFDFFLGGGRHRELVVSGAAATTTARMEQVAVAGEVVVSAATAAQLPARCSGPPRGDGFLLRRAPDVAPRSRAWPRSTAVHAGRLLDPAIRDHLLTEVGESEHRQVAVGFLEVSGVDGLLARQGPGATASALHELLVLVQEQCGRHRVTFWETDIAVDGFKVMLVSGAPRSSGHDEEDLLRAARSVLDGHTGPLQVRIGVNCGRVFSGGFGPPFRRAWSVKGDAVNLAARVMGKAGAGELLATEALLGRVTAPVVARQLEPFRVKGKQQQVRASAVTAVAAGRSLSNGTAELVGRADLLGPLAARVAAATAGRGGAVLLHGEPGVGKSRVVEAVIAKAGSARVVRCFADDYQSSTPHYVLGRVLLAALDLPSSASDAAAVDTVAQLLTTARPSLLPQLPLLAEALGIERPETPESAAVLGEFRQARLAVLVVDVLTLALAGPTVILVEDVQHADEASAEVLAAVASAASERPWLLLLVGRSGPASLSGSASVEQLPVPPLTADEARSLALAGGADGLPAHVLRALVTRAEGNPLFLLELVAAVAADGDELPGSLEELLVARIDDLAPRQRQVMRVAAVLGTRFDEAVLAALLPEPVEQQTWEALQRFLVVDSPGSRRFRSGLVRDVAYEGLPYRRRVQLHGQAADLLRQTPDGDADLPGLLSLHTLAARRYDEAWHWSVLAGRRAQAVHANAEALSFLARARTAATRLPELDAARHAEVLEAIGDVHARLADLEPAVLAYREARRRAPLDQPLIRARVALSTALVSQRAGQLARSSRWLTTAQRDCGAGTPERDELAARITVERAFVQHMVGREARARALATEALAAADRVGAVGVKGRALLLLEWVALWTGSVGDDTRALEALHLFEQCGDLPRQGGAWNHLGMSAFFRGEWDVAVERYAEAQRVHERCADDWNAAIASANIAEIRLAQGRLDEAEPLVTEALRVWRTSGTPSDIGFGAALLGRLCAWRGKGAEAMVLLAEAAACFAVNSERMELLDVELRLAEALLLQGSATAADARLDDADERLREAVRLGGMPSTDGVPRTPHTVALLRLRAVAAAQRGDRDRARQLLTASADVARALGNGHELALTLQTLTWLDDQPSPEADELLRRLGVVWAPQFPRRATVAALPPVPSARQPSG